MIFLKDKKDNGYSIEKPTDYLSERAIQRRAKSKIKIVEQDLPVSGKYLTQLSSLGIEVYYTSKWFNAVLVQTDVSKLNEILSLNFVDSIVYAAPGKKLSRTKVPINIPNSFLTTKNPNKYSSELQNAMLNIDDMLNDGYNGQGVMIAVFDGGFLGVNNSSFFELLHKEKRIVDVADFVGNSGNPYQYHYHGSAVLSVICGNNDGSYQGIASKSEYLLYVTEDTNEEYRIEEFNWLIGAERADSVGADIIQSSLGYYDFDDKTMDYTFKDLDGETAYITKAANIAFSKGMVLVASVGNTDTKHMNALADSRYVISVGAINLKKEWASFSSVGPSYDGRIKPDVTALGNETRVFINSDNSISISNGTSFSSPIVTGFIAGIMQKHKDWDNKEILDRIKNCSDRVDKPDNKYGFGIPNYKNIENQLIKLSLEENVSFKMFPNPVIRDYLNLNFDFDKLNKPLNIRIFASDGNKIYDLYDIIENVSLNVSSYKNGLYFLLLEESNYNFKTYKFIKQ